MHAFRHHLDQLAQQHPQLQRFVCYEQTRAQDPAPDATGLLSQEQLRRWMPASVDVDAYFVGPRAFMQAIKRHLREIGVPPAQSRFEFFGPAATLD